MATVQDIEFREPAARAAEAAASGELRDMQGEKMVLNMGPSHPSTHGVLRILLEMDGEIITKAMPDIGYLHRGDEKIAVGDISTSGGGLSFYVRDQAQLLVERSWPSPLVPAAATPMALGCVAFASFALPDRLQEASPLVPALRSSWLVMHVSVIMISYAALLVGSLRSLAVLFTDRGNSMELRSSSIGSGGYRQAQLATPQLQLSSVAMPAVEQLDSLSYRTITVGFLLLSVGLVSGAVWANEAWGSWWSWDPKETWALICWLVYAAYLHTRLIRGWQGRKPAFVAVAGLVVIAVCYIGVNLLGIGLHSYGWFFDS